MSSPGHGRDRARRRRARDRDDHGATRHGLGAAGDRRHSGGRPRLVIPDYTLIAMLALSPAIIVFAFTGVPGDQGGVGDILYWHRVNLVIMFVGGLLWAATAIAYHRRSRNACVSCGRGDGPPTAWPTPEQALRWGRVAVTVASSRTSRYEFTRVAWYFGWPLGITDEFHQMMVDTPGMLEMGLAHGRDGHRRRHPDPRPGAPLGRGLSALDLVQGGQAGPTAAGDHPGVAGGRRTDPGRPDERPAPDGRGQLGGEPPRRPWVLWGAALGAATYAYYLRRRTYVPTVRTRCHVPKRRSRCA